MKDNPGAIVKWRMTRAIQSDSATIQTQISFVES